eukprot:770955-Rhodomonas_salina.1
MAICPRFLLLLVAACAECAMCGTDRRPAHALCVAICLAGPNAEMEALFPSSKTLSPPLSSPLPPDADPGWEEREEREEREEERDAREVQRMLFQLQNPDSCNGRRVVVRSRPAQHVASMDRAIWYPPPLPYYECAVRYPVLLLVLTLSLVLTSTVLRPGGWPLTCTTSRCSSTTAWYTTGRCSQPTRTTGTTPAAGRSLARLLRVGP